MAKFGRKPGEDEGGISLKDTFNFVGIPSTLGLIDYSDHKAKSKSALVDILLDLGAVLYCKTNVPHTLGVRKKPSWPSMMLGTSQ